MQASLTEKQIQTIGQNENFQIPTTRQEISCRSYQKQKSHVDLAVPILRAFEKSNKLSTIWMQVKC